MRSVGRLIGATLVTLGLAAPATAAPPPLDVPGAVVEGEAIVRFEPGTGPNERIAARDAAGVELERPLELPQAQVVNFDGSLDSALDRLERSPDVAYAQPNYRYEALAPAPNDTFFDRLWGLRPNPGLDVLRAWDRSRGAGQVIAIVDSGIDLTHPDLAARLWRNPDEQPGDGDDDDGNGLTDDARGADFVADPDRDSHPDDYHFHGTHAAGIAAAEAGNRMGVAGVAPGASIMAVRVLNGNGGGTSQSIGDGIVYAAEEDADVINLSLGAGGMDDQYLVDGLTVAKNRDAVVVAAAGNEGANNDANPWTPCTLPGAHMICAAALTSGGALEPTSNYGARNVDVAAPGALILSTKSDWATIYSDGFETGTAGWSTYADPGGEVWGTDFPPIGSGSSSRSAADSPGGSYAPDRYTEITRGVSLVGRRGCRMHFDVLRDLYPPGPGFIDTLLAGAFPWNETDVNVGRAYSGSSGGRFEPAEVSISDLDGRGDAHIFFGLDSMDSLVDDGVYVDDLRVRCRDGTYTNAIAPADDYAAPNAGSYMYFTGTSMAAPHVAGIAALVRAAAPRTTAAQVVEAIKAGATRRPALSGRVASGGSANAAGALDVILGPAQAPRGAQPVTSGGQTQPPTRTTSPLTRSPARPRTLDLRRARRTIRVGRSGRFVYAFRVAPGLRGDAMMRTRARVRLSDGRRRRLTVVNKPFRSPRNGRVQLRIRLSRGELAVLRRHRRLPVQVRMRVTEPGGRVVRAERALTLLRPRRAAA